MDRPPRSTAGTSASQSAIYHSRRPAPGPVGDLVGACCRPTCAQFQPSPLGHFQHLSASFGWHKNGLARDDPHSCDRPVIAERSQLSSSMGDSTPSQRDKSVDPNVVRVSRSPSARDTRDFWNIGGHRYTVAVLECLEHLRNAAGPPLW